MPPQEASLDAPKASRAVQVVIPRIVCVVGPTSSGKTDLGIYLATRFEGEVINADARQIYRDLSIGTGKPSKGVQGLYRHRKIFLVDDVPHHVMDVLPPDQLCTVTEWRQKALDAIGVITRRKHLPIVVGGTGLYIQSLVDNYQIPAVPPQSSFREAMESKSLKELVELLRRTDPEAAKVVDLKNPRRVLRALEVMTFTGQSFVGQRIPGKKLVDALLIAPYQEKELLHERIALSVDRMIQRGWIEEIERLRDQGVSWDAPAMTSIGYRELGMFVRGELGRDEAIELVKRATRQYAKRQMTWFKKDKRIHWVKTREEAEELVRVWKMRVVGEA